MKHRFYTIRQNEDGYNAFISFDPIFPVDLRSVSRVKIAIDLWHKYHMNYRKFIRYFNHLTITRPHAYNHIWGKLITVAQLRKLAAS